MPEYRQYLAERRYSTFAQLTYVACVAHFARWFAAGGRLVSDLTLDDIGAFLDEHLPDCDCPGRVHRGRHRLHAALRHLLVVLDQIGAMTRPPLDAIDLELGRFDAHLQQERGLAHTTRVQRGRIIRRFLGQSPRFDFTVRAQRDPRLRQFVTQHLQHGHPASARVLADALRSYLRFRIGRGDAVAHLLPVIATPAHWRLAPLPETLTPGEITQVLAAFPPELPSGRRAYAITRCVVDLGLRCREVVSLELADLDWAGGRVIIRGSKARRIDALPLPVPTGEAIADYLRLERPATASHRVFVRHVAPVDVPLGPSIVRKILRAAYRRCGCSHTGVHVLRHTLASRLLASGGTLKEVADVLRHRDLNTSLIYAKVDVNRLAAVALPWPGRRP